MKDPASVEDRVRRLIRVLGVAFVNVSFEVLELAVYCAAELSRRRRNHELLGSTPVEVDVLLCQPVRAVDGPATLVAALAKRHRRLPGVADLVDGQIRRVEGHAAVAGDRFLLGMDPAGPRTGIGTPDTRRALIRRRVRDDCTDVEIAG